MKYSCYDCGKVSTAEEWIIESKKYLDNLAPLNEDTVSLSQV